MVQVEGPAKHFESREWKEFHFIKTSWILSNLLKELLTRFDPFSSKKTHFRWFCPHEIQVLWEYLLSLQISLDFSAIDRCSSNIYVLLKPFFLSLMGPDMIAAICQEQLLEFPLGHFNVNINNIKAKQYRPLTE